MGGAWVVLCGVMLWGVGKSMSSTWIGEVGFEVGIFLDGDWAWGLEEVWVVMVRRVLVWYHVKRKIFCLFIQNFPIPHKITPHSTTHAPPIH